MRFSEEKPPRNPSPPADKGEDGNNFGADISLEPTSALTVYPEEVRGATIRDLDIVLGDEVFGRWEASCGDAENPWEATQELRSRWGEMMSSGDRTAALAGAIGLSRAANLIPSETNSIEAFFNHIADEGVPPDVLLSVLLSGASPPHLFSQAFLGMGLLEGQHLGSLYWRLLSSYLRHPHTAVFPIESLFPHDVAVKIKYLVNSNPARGLEYEHGGQWFSAQKSFRKGRKVAGSIVTEIVGIGEALRSEDGGEIARNRILALCLEGVLEREFLEHPCISKGPAPKFSPLCPDRRAIDYYAGGDAVSRVWRFYNPLLILPWLMETVEESCTPVSYLGRLLCGMVPSEPYSGPGQDVVGRISAGHPLSPP